MAAITETHKAANDAMARHWLKINGFELVGDKWIGGTRRWARCEPMPSGKVMIYVGVV